MKELMLAAALLGQPTPVNADTNLSTNNITLPTTDIYSSSAPEATQAPLPQEAIIMNEIIDGFLTIDKSSSFYQEMLEKQRSNFGEYFYFSYDEQEGSFESNFAYFPQGLSQESPLDKLSYSFGSEEVVLEDGTTSAHLEAAMVLRVGENGTLEDNSLPEIGRFTRDEMISLAEKYLLTVPPFEHVEWLDDPLGGGVYKAIDLAGTYMTMEARSDGTLSIYQETTEILQ